MFGKLKDKLKGALDVFSKKTEEEAEEKIVEVEETVEEKVPEVINKVKEAFDDKGELKEKPVKKTKSADSIIEEEKKEAEKEKKKQEYIKEKLESKKQEQVLEEAETDTEKDMKVKSVEEKKGEEPAVEKTGFFGKLKKSIFGSDEDEKEELSEEDLELEKVHELIEKAQTEEVKEISIEEVPTEFNLAQQKHVPNLEKIKEKSEKVKEDSVKRVVVEPEVKEPKEDVKQEPVKEIVKEEPKVEEEQEPVKEDPVEEKKETGFFGKLKKSFTTKTISADKFEELFWDLELILLENNVSVQVIDKIKQDLSGELVDKPLPRDVLGKINDTLKRTLTEILTFDKIDLLSNVSKKKPYIIALFGINGAGKTTSVAKLTNYFKENGKTVVLAACDTFRAAAIQQLEEHATKLDVKIIKHDYGSDAAAVAYDAIKYAEKQGVDVVIIDTAGRLHSNVNLMAELEKVIRVTQPDLKIFVGESITGNDCIEQAQKFNELVEMDGAILTKADVDEKGGAPLSISYVINKPILFLGVGQEYKDLEEFDVEKVLNRLGFGE